MLLTGRARIGLVVVAILAVPVMLMAACGGGDDDDSETTAPTSEATATPLDGAAGGGDDAGDGEVEAFEEVYPVNQTFWHSGFMVEIGDAIYAGTEPDIFGEQDITLTLEATFTNEGPNEDYLFATVTLITPDDTRTIPPGLGGLPNVPSGMSADGEYVFPVDENFSIDEAYILVGDGDEQQAQVPLGPGAGELVALEPVDVPVTGTISTSLVDLNFTGGELRADYPSSHRQVEAGKLALTLNFDATSRKSGNWSVFPTEFALVQPDGSPIGVDAADLPSLPGSDAGIETQDLSLRFLVDDPPADGTYALRFTPSDRFVTEGEPTEITLEFEL